MRATGGVGREGQEFRSTYVGTYISLVPPARPQNVAFDKGF